VFDRRKGRKKTSRNKIWVPQEPRRCVICLSALIGLGSALIQGSASSRAARAQERAAGRQLELSERIYDEGRESTAPYREAGENALAAYQSDLGLGERPEGYAGFEGSDAYRYNLESGRDTIEAGAAARGGLYSGSTLTALERFRSNLTSSEVNNHLNRLASVANQGLSATGLNANIGAGHVAAGSNALANVGNAQAAGAVGWGNALASGINTGMGAYGFFSNRDQAPVNIGGHTTATRGTALDLFQSGGWM